MGVPFSPEGLRSGRLLEGRVAVVSGAARERGIGKAIARLFVAHGARVALLDLDADGAAAAADDVAREAGAGADPGSVAIGLRCDVARKADGEAAIARVLAWPGAGGRLDVLVNNAGLTQKRGTEEVTEDDLARVTGVVLNGTVFLTQAALPAMRERRGGSIVNVSSLSAQQGGGIFGGAHYGAAKAGVLGFTRAVAREFGPEGIRCNAVTPGLVHTDFSRTGRSDAERDASTAGWPLQRAAHAVEIAGACLFLASDLASYVTGATLDVNGGAYMR